MEFQILLSLKDEARDAEGIVGRMRELGETDEPPIASFYRGLKKALEAGHLEILETADAGKRGRPPKRYRITRAGRASLETEARRLGRLARFALAESRESR
jgi:DNA-binding PadR family transcriptional regulator